MRVFSRVFNITIALYAGVTLVGLLFVIFDRTDIALIEFGKTGFLFTLWLAPVLVIGALVLRRRRLMIGVLPALAGFLFIFGTPYLPKSMPEATTSFTVMSYNVLSEIDGWQDVVRIIRESDADIIALQELGKPMADAIALNLADIYPYQALNPQEGQWNYFRGQGVLSRYPIIEDEYWQYTDLPESHGHQRVVIDINGQPLALYNVHPWPPIDWGGGLSFGFISDEDTAHKETIHRLLARAQTEADAVLLLGDFNMSDQFEEYRTITTQYNDVYREVGRGMGYTYPAEGLGMLGQIIRLDYVFRNEGLQAISAHVVAEAGPSDHLPVWVQLAFVK